MTPAINIAKKHQIGHTVHEYVHDASVSSYGAEAAEKLGAPAEQVFKTLVVSLDDRELAVAIIPVLSRLSLKHAAKALGAKRALMATKSDVERSTGYVLGGVSPLGQKKRLRTVIDISADRHTSIFVSAGRRGVDLELSPSDLKTLLNGKFAELCQ
ncbi:Cys-tRNA(Pro) deacylase [Aliidiomarina soli]|uniref:Cys-tRNA(Pro)/Cys-tRNA(Cys) deacylase n=1 Tax=Aliidiomarina soli TaxID=1928574 RepID=A0A432WLX1_9GAMM|nr:Cys-tRNA(Pro) deacylase [Aliidiomarina soli]RUO34816.1 Cys-tRNA(Pro) deacylase [Aliidiomarina soli]